MITIDKVIFENDISEEATVNLIRYIYEYILPNLSDETKDRILEEAEQKLKIKE